MEKKNTDCIFAQNKPCVQHFEINDVPSYIVKIQQKRQTKKNYYSVVKQVKNKSCQTERSGTQEVHIFPVSQANRPLGLAATVAEKACVALDHTDKPEFFVVFFYSPLEISYCTMKLLNAMQINAPPSSTA